MNPIKNNGLLTLDYFRGKYTEITGVVSIDCQKLNKRKRDRFNLKSVCTVEQFVGSQNKNRKRYIWRWERN